MTEKPVRRERKDVARNRALLLETADKLIADRGLNVSFHDLAAAAGVGVGTVYRHFADKDALLGALIEQRFEQTRDVLLAGEQIEDPVEALRTTVQRVCAMHQADRALMQVMFSHAKQHQAMAESMLKPITTRIVDRAKATGRLRADFAVTDVPVMFVLNGLLGPFIAETRQDLWQRYIDALLDGFMTSDADRVGAGAPPPASDAEITEIMRTERP